MNKRHAFVGNLSSAHAIARRPVLKTSSVISGASTAQDCEKPLSAKNDYRNDLQQLQLRIVRNTVFYRGIMPAARTYGRDPANR
jgi:hypothetical protein